MDGSAAVVEPGPAEPFLGSLDECKVGWAGLLAKAFGIPCIYRVAGLAAMPLTTLVGMVAG